MCTFARMLSRRRQQRCTLQGAPTLELDVVESRCADAFVEGTASSGGATASPTMPDV
jgi:hypothetical protein